MADAFPEFIRVVFVVTDEAHEAITEGATDSLDSVGPSLSPSTGARPVTTVYGRLVDAAMISEVLGDGGGGGGSRGGSVMSLLCGPPGMIEAMEEECVACGIDRQRIHYEKWW